MILLVCNNLNKLYNIATRMVRTAAAGLEKSFSHGILRSPSQSGVARCATNHSRLQVKSQAD